MFSYVIIIVTINNMVYKKFGVYLENNFGYKKDGGFSGKKLGGFLKKYESTHFDCKIVVFEYEIFHAIKKGLKKKKIWNPNFAKCFL